MTVLSLFFIAFGLAGLFGVTIIPKKYKGYVWTGKYKRIVGISYILLGFPWLIISMFCDWSSIESGFNSMLIKICCFIPAIVFAFYFDRKFKKLYKEEQTKQL